MEEEEEEEEEEEVMEEEEEAGGGGGRTGGRQPGVGWLQMPRNYHPQDTCGARSRIPSPSPLVPS